MIKKVKNTVKNNDLYREKIIGTLLQKWIAKNKIKKNLELKKVIKKKSDKLHAKWKGYNNSFNTWRDKKHSIMNEFFPKPKSLGANVKIEFDLSSYATKADLKNPTGADTSDFAKKIDLASLKPDVEKLDTGKLETTLIDLSKLNDVVKNEAVEKTECNELVK